MLMARNFLNYIQLLTPTQLEIVNYKFLFKQNWLTDFEVIVKI